MSMRNNNVYLFIAIAFGAIGWLMAIIDIEEKLIEKAPWLSQFMPYVWLMLIFIFGIFLVLGVVYLAQTIVYFISTRPSRLAGFRWDVCKSVDIEPVFEFSQRQLGSLQPLEATQECYNYNKKCLIKVRPVSSDEIVGYIFIIPITKNGEELIRSSNYDAKRDGLTVFCKNKFPKRTNYYLGAAAGASKIVRAKIITILRILAENYEIDKIYSRAITEEGLKALCSNGFAPTLAGERAALNIMMVRQLTIRNPSSKH